MSRINRTRREQVAPYWQEGRKRQTRNSLLYEADIRRLERLRFEWHLKSRAQVIEALIDTVSDPANQRLLGLPGGVYTRLDVLGERLGLSTAELLARLVALAVELSPGELARLLLGTPAHTP